MATVRIFVVTFGEPKILEYRTCTTGANARRWITKR